MKNWFVGLMTLCFAFWSTAQSVELKFFSSFAAYERELRLFESGKSKLTLEQLYNQAMNLNEIWINDHQVIYKASKKPNSNDIDRDLYQQVVKPYEEFAVNSEHTRFSAWNADTLGALPNNSFFQKLSQARGSKVDKDFFDATVLAQQNSYLQVTRHFSSCTVYGKGYLVRSYGVWQKYISQHPQNYQSFATERLENAQEELTEGSCVCGSKKSWLKEINLFIKTYPESELVPVLKHRRSSPTYSAPNVKQYPMRFNCFPG